MVTCPYRGVPSPAPPRRTLPHCGRNWKALGMSIEMTAGVMVANMLEGMQFALGPTMAVRSACVQEIGGFRCWANIAPTIFFSAIWWRRRGIASSFRIMPIDHIVLNTGFVALHAHQVRWSKSTRFSRPKGHSAPRSPSACRSACWRSRRALRCIGHRCAALSLAWAIVTRMLLAAMVGAGVVRERSARRARMLLLSPARSHGLLLLGRELWQQHIPVRGELMNIACENRVG